MSCEFINEAGFKPHEVEALRVIIGSAGPTLRDMTLESGKTLDELFAIVCSDNDDLTIVVCEVERRHEFALALGDDPEVARVIREAGDVPAMGLLRTVVVFVRNGLAGCARVRVQIHEGDFS